MTGRGTILVTGGGKRIGAAISRALAASGWKVLIHYNHSQEQAEALAMEIRASGGACETIHADLSKRCDIDSFINRCISLHGKLDCLVNNAANFANDSVANITWESFEANMIPNLAAPLFLSRDFAASFADREGGCIINILDQKIDNLNPDFLSYTISKVALSGLTKMLAMAYSPRIRVCGIAPGITLISGKQTEESFQRAWRATPLGRSSTPEEIAATVEFILATPSLTGHTIFVDGGESLQGRPRDVAFDPQITS